MQRFFARYINDILKKQKELKVHDQGECPCPFLKKGELPVDDRLPDTRIRQRHWKKKLESLCPGGGIRFGPICEHMG